MEQVSKGHACAGTGIQLCCHTQLHKRLLHNQILIKDNNFAVLKHMTDHIQHWSSRKTLSTFQCGKWDTDSSYSTGLQSLPKISSTPIRWGFFPLFLAVWSLIQLRECDVSFPKCSFTTSKVQDEWRFKQRLRYHFQLQHLKVLRTEYHFQHLYSA